MKYKEMLITPTYAKSLLENNVNNRSINGNKVSQYAEDMRNGKWQLNGEDIEISESGRVLNGQHRLSAIIRYGKPVMMGIKFGVSDDVWIYDRGRLRSSSDCLKMSGLPNELSRGMVVRIVKAHWKYLEGGIHPTDPEIEKFILSHKKAFYTINEIFKGKNKTSRGTKVNCQNVPLTTAVFYAVEAGVDVDDLKRFVQVVHTGICESRRESAAIVLRNDIIARLVRAEENGIQMCEKAIVDYLNGYSRQRSYTACKEKIYSEEYRSKYAK